MTEYRDSILEVKDVSLVLGGNQILRDVQLTVRDIVGHGQVVGLLGPSGIGKTQLFRILSGLQQPTTGHVLLNEERKPVVVGEVGVVAQDYRLLVHRTVLGNLIFAGRRAGLSRKEAKERALTLLEKLGLKDRADFYPKQLSGGQRQRIAIAQQLLCSKHFLLMDEPFSGLDILALDVVCGLIAQVASMHELNTIIVVTHDVRAAMKVADTLVLMGRDRDAGGSIVTGARIVETYNLVARGLAWHPDVSKTPEFDAMYHEVSERFRTL